MYIKTEHSFFCCFRENGLENVITLVKGKAEEVTLPVDKVCVLCWYLRVFQLR